MQCFTLVLLRHYIIYKCQLSSMQSLRQDYTINVTLTQFERSQRSTSNSSKILISIQSSLQGCHYSILTKFLTISLPFPNQNQNLPKQFYLYCFDLCHTFSSNIKPIPMSHSDYDKINQFLIFFTFLHALSRIPNHQGKLPNFSKPGKCKMKSPTFPQIHNPMGILVWKEFKHSLRSYCTNKVAGWLDGFMDGWMDGWMDRWMDRWTKL